MIEKIPLEKMTLYGIQGASMVPLASFSVLDASLRQESINELLSSLASNENVIIANTLIFTEGYDAFRVV